MNFSALAAQHRPFVATGAVAILLFGGLAIFLLRSVPSTPPATKPPPVTMVMIQPKPPPPPPPLPQPKTIVQPKMAVPEPKPMVPATPPKAAPPKAPGPAATHMGTSIHGSGPDAFNLSGTPGGNGMLDGGGGGGGSRWGAYAAMVQNQIQAALQDNKTTRNAAAGLEVRIWTDASGRVTRVSLDKSSGSTAVDQAVANQVLRGMKLAAPPPAGMPMPIVMRLTAKQAL